MVLVEGMALMHMMTATVHGRSDTRCGLNVKSDQATGWETEVMCEGCIVMRSKKVYDSLREAALRDRLSAAESNRHTDKGDREMARATTLTIDKDLAEQVTQLRDVEEKKWDEIGEITGVAVGKCMLAYMAARVPKKELIKNATDADVVRLRDKMSLSWGEISVRCQLPESTCRAMYTDGTGNTTKGLRIGKGGRHPGDVEGIPRKKAAGKATVSKKAAAQAASLEGVEDSEVAALITGYAIKVSTGSGDPEAIKVKSVKRVAKGKAVLVDGTTGETRTIKLAAITAISKRKVL